MFVLKLGWLPYDFRCAGLVNQILQVRLGIFPGGKRFMVDGFGCDLTVKLSFEKSLVLNLETSWLFPGEKNRKISTVSPFSRPCEKLQIFTTWATWAASRFYRPSWCVKNKQKMRSVVAKSPVLAGKPDMSWNSSPNLCPTASRPTLSQFLVDLGSKVQNLVQDGQPPSDQLDPKSKIFHLQRDPFLQDPPNHAETSSISGAFGREKKSGCMAVALAELSMASELLQQVQLGGKMGEENDVILNWTEWWW